MFNLIGPVLLSLHLGMTLRTLKIKALKVMLRERILKGTSPHLVLYSSVTTVRVMSMLLPIVQPHLRLSSLTKFSLKRLSLIAQSPRKSPMWLRSLMLLPRLPWLLSLLLLPQLPPALFLPWSYCQRHLLRLLYCRPLISLLVFFLLYCWHHLFSPRGMC